MAVMIDLRGQRFGRLVALEPTKERRSGQVMWICQCDCGNTKLVRSKSLRKGETSSCGCLNKEVSRKRIIECSTKHGWYGTRVYNTWHHIVDRCTNPNAKAYEHYGGRGIKICQEWRENPASFCEWAMANGYKDDLTIDRINHDGDYEPNNCRWITNAKQQTNKRNNKMLTYKGKTQCVADWIRELNLDKARTYNRIANGWTDIEEIFFSDRDKRKERYYG